MSKLCMHCTGRDHLHDPGCPVLGQPPQRPHPKPTPVPNPRRDYVDLGGDPAPHIGVPADPSGVLYTGAMVDDSDAIDPLHVLRCAGDAMVRSVVVIGTDPTGEFYFASSSADARQVLWLLEKGRHFLLTQAK